jgi:hypothetical protein
MSQCNETFDRIASQLGNFTCRDAPAVIHLRNPFALSNWTLPILELMMVTVAVAALWWAIRRLRRDGDPTNLVLWSATTVYLLLIEPPLYFPNVFGIEDQVGVVFAHNAFTVQFLFERLPLYIVALYPAVLTLAYEIVRALGVFRDRGVVIGAICVAFVHHCLYEVFAQLGPQLRWWAWNTENPINHPFLASVPMSSVVIFATIGPLVTVLLAQLFVGRKVQRGRHFGAAALIWRTLAVGALVPIGVVVLSIPSSIFGGAAPNTTAQAIVYAVELLIVTAIACPVLLRQWRRTRAGSPTGAELPNGFVRVFGPLYLGVLGALWISALPQYFSAVDGVTHDGTPIGNGWYAGVSFVLNALAVAAVAMPPKATHPQSVRERQLDRA